jgi:hypothetical protein
VLSDVFRISDVILIDQKGGGLSVVSRLGLFKAMNAVGADHYPEFSGPIFVLFAPWMFTKIFGLVKPILDADTAGKIVVANDLAKPVLDKLLSDLDSFLPQAYGGQNPTVLKATCHADKS